MLNESKYYKNGIMSSATTSTASSSLSSNSSHPNSLKPSSNFHETSKSHHLNHSNNNNNNNNNSHHHFNLHTFNQYNQPNKTNVNMNSKNFNDYNNNNNSINKEILNSFDSSPKLINLHSNNNSKNNGYSSICSSTSSSTSSTGSVNVKFAGFFKDKVDEREKYLTAKYPNHQMALIKKRLKVEFWIDEQLKSLFDISVSTWFNLTKYIKRNTNTFRSISSKYIEILYF